MNIPISWTEKFNAIAVIGDEIVCNNYSCRLDLLTNSEDMYEQNVCLNRMKLFITEVLYNCVFVDNDSELIKTVHQFNNPIVTTMGNPHDLTICMHLYCKLQAITEGKMVIKAIHFSSTHSDNVEYTINLSDNLEVFKDDKKSKVLPWWHRADITVSDYFDSKGEHAVEEIETWEELGLGWTESLASSDTEAEILDIRAFKPEVIQGGRD
jgi:hypothetical protein